MSDIIQNLKLKFLLITIITIPMLKLSSYILYFADVIETPTSMHHVVILWIMIPFLLFLYIYGLCKKNDSFTYFDIITILLTILAIISTIFAINVNVSIFGEVRRDEGLLTLISYYLIFLNAKSIKESQNKKILINTFLGLGLFQVLYSIIQVYTTLPINRHNIPYMATGLCGNPNFLASYMSMLVILAGSLFVKTKKKIYLFLAIAYNIGLTLAQSTGPFIAIILSLIFIIIYFHKKEYIIRTLLLSLVLFFSFIITNYSSIYVQENITKNEIRTEYNIQKELVSTFKRALNGSWHTEKIGNGRMRIWKNLIPKVKDYWILGAGIDNIRYIYPQNGRTIVNKAHNVYLQILLTNGVFALTLYLALAFITFIKGFKLKDENVALYMVFIVYSIQAFGNISVIDVAPYFFLVWGLVVSNFTQKNELKLNTN